MYSGGEGSTICAPLRADAARYDTCRMLVASCEDQEASGRSSSFSLERPPEGEVHHRNIPDKQRCLEMSKRLAEKAPPFSQGRLDAFRARLKAESETPPEKKSAPPESPTPPSAPSCTGDRCISRPCQAMSFIPSRDTSGERRRVTLIFTIAIGDTLCGHVFILEYTATTVGSSVRIDYQLLDAANDKKPIGGTQHIEIPVDQRDRLELMIETKEPDNLSQITRAFLHLP